MQMSGMAAWVRINMATPMAGNGGEPILNHLMKPRLAH